MNKYYKGMIENVKQNYNIKDSSSLEELIVTFEYVIEENQKYKEVIDKAIEYIKETRNHYKELLKEKYNQETSVFVNETCKKGFILCVISYLDLLELQIKDILKEVE